MSGIDLDAGVMLGIPKALNPIVVEVALGYRARVRI